ncbi:MAG: bifunctional hydroxymethylpyrimidine kinase/phosphomethylpyrimidine kinase [Candidatus Omnitrophica bacterium]|nr:bifunctional hydroxymethylpyrimidine kinase/phosphomethylpyrimidine kinase [Candidatus Omnitrophota bacterium]
MTRPAVALSIAGWDPSGGAGLAADLKTFRQRGVHGLGVLTLVTVQNTRCLKEVRVLDARLVRDELKTLLEDFNPGAAKTGALGSPEVVEAVADAARTFRFPLVVDPVMVSGTGTRLLDKDAVAIMRLRLLPLARLVTPNVDEARVLSGRPVSKPSDFADAARAISDQGAGAVLIKGGHAGGRMAKDFLLYDRKNYVFSRPRIEKRAFHGAGCILSAAITAELAKGLDVLKAVRAAEDYVHRALMKAVRLGRGSWLVPQLP